VDIEAGNFQELIDMSFDFYEGIPPRNLIKMTEIWGPYRPISYRKLSGDEELSEKEFNITKSTEQVKLKSRLTGHGHHSNTGEPPHCCEWKDNEHFIFVNKQQAASWHIWRDDCSVNPVYPQGGTWPGLREGWCPGDMVRDFDFELTPYIADGKMTIDYGITPVPQDNLGMGTGDYVVSMQVFEYGKANHEIDAEVYDIITPSLEQIYSRKNPVCKGPVIVIRNNGTSNLTSLTFEYGVSGAKQEIYSWNGNLKPNLRDTVELPIPNSAFWLGNVNRIFSVKVKMPNGQNDMYAVNDTMTSGFQIPDLIAKGTKLKLRTHNYGDILHLVVKDLAGNVVLNRNVLQSNTEYIENIDFSDGCYTLELTNDYDFGLSYWAVSSQGTGYLQLLNENNQVIKTFNPDFGRSIVYSYHSGNISYIEDSQMDYLLRIFPLPAENAVNIQIDTQIGEAVMELFDFSGKSILTQNINLPEAAPMKLDVSNLSSGNYFIKISNSQFDMKRTFIKK